MDIVNPSLSSPAFFSYCLVGEAYTPLSARRSRGQMLPRLFLPPVNGDTPGPGEEPL